MIADEVCPCLMFHDGSINVQHVVDKTSVVCSQKHHSAALPDHHPGEEVSKGASVPGGFKECSRGGQSEVRDTRRGGFCPP